MGKLILFPHQKEAIKKLDSFYSEIDNSFSGIVSIPTGGGKTFTAVYWILEQLRKENRKIIWLAQSFELLNQAQQTFLKSSADEGINLVEAIRLVSSHNDHSKINDITDEDSILIITTQTAIQAMKQETSNLYQFIERHKDENLIVVLDEAHHAPAYGCRNLLLRLKELVSRMWLLGLTATPTYTDIKRRGWLWNIFDGGIIYQVEKALLQKQHILAKENIIRKKTPMKIAINEELFNVLVRQHRDIPEHIIEQIASNTERNNFIVNDYLNHKDDYGKTIIFLDRWFQCIYIKEKLIETGVKADAIFYQNDCDNKVRSGEAMTNKQIIDCFKHDELEVLLNVKMLTEGADVPDVKTVFITRDTTSHILLQQMIGRALRGERAGGKKDIANIVLFGDNWDKTIAWAKPEGEGNIDDARIKNKSVPGEQISINLMEQLVKNLTFESVQINSFMDMIPIGWYQTEFVIFEAGMDAVEIVRESVLIYQETQNAFENLINDCNHCIDEQWAKENMDEEFIYSAVSSMVHIYFHETLVFNSKETRKGIISICRHIAQNRTAPKYYPFYNRESCNLETIAEKVLNLLPKLQYQYLLEEYNRAGALWRILYSSFYHFKSATDIYVNKLLFENPNQDMVIQPQATMGMNVEKSASERVKIQAIKGRDNNTCSCCGLTSKETKLEVDSILPIEMFGGNMQIQNMQTLCSKCRRENQGKNINFLMHISPLAAVPLFNENDFDIKYKKNISRIKAALRSSINTTFQCGAVYDIFCSRRSNSPYYGTWTVLLYDGNNPMWLRKNKDNILEYINEVLQQKHVHNVHFELLI